VPDWDNQKALTIFEQMLQKTSNKIDGVLAANDGLGNAAISALKQRKLPQIPVTGQDATLRAAEHPQRRPVHDRLQGDQEETDASAALAIQLLKGETPSTRPPKVNNGNKDVPSILLEPVAVTKDNIKDYIGEADFPKKEDICAGKVAEKCTAAGPVMTDETGGRREAPSTSPILELRGSPSPSARSRRCSRWTSTSPPAR
jgi:D-xylose transport system substrate-binding protein